MAEAVVEGAQISGEVVCLLTSARLEDDGTDDSHEYFSNML